jgi:hypothetical protein
MELSLAGLIGAVVGTAISALFYGRLIDAVEALLRRGRSPAEGATSVEELALLRRGILAADMLLCAGLGYWIGLKVGG